MKQKIKIVLTYDHVWYHHPLTIETKLNGHLLNLDVSGQNKVIIEKTVGVEKGPQTLSLVISGKDNANNLFDDNGDLIQNTLVQIQQLEIDDVNLTHMILNGESLFQSSDTPSKTLENTLTFGFNGAWKMQFEVPFYDWLLGKLF